MSDKIYRILILVQNNVSTGETHWVALHFSIVLPYLRQRLAELCPARQNVLVAGLVTTTKVERTLLVQRLLNNCASSLGTSVRLTVWKPCTVCKKRRTRYSAVISRRNRPSTLGSIFVFLLRGSPSSSYNLSLNSNRQASCSSLSYNRRHGLSVYSGPADRCHV